MPTKLYSFGSNHYGQLGVGQYYELDNLAPDLLLRSLVPIEVFINKNIRLIHTKFFTNVSSNDRWYLEMNNSLFFNSF